MYIIQPPMLLLFWIIVYTVDTCLASPVRQLHLELFQRMAICINTWGREILWPWQFLQFLPFKSIPVFPSVSSTVYYVPMVHAHAMCQWSQGISDDLIFLCDLCIVLSIMKN